MSIPNWKKSLKLIIKNFQVPLRKFIPLPLQNSLNPYRSFYSSYRVKGCFSLKGYKPFIPDLWPVNRISAELIFNILNMNVLKFMNLNFTALTHIFVTCSGQERLRQNKDLRQYRQCHMTWGSLSRQTLSGSGFPSSGWHVLLGPMLEEAAGRR